MNLFRATVRSTHIRRRVAASRMCCERLAYAYRPVTPFPQQARRGRILCYHSVGTPAWGVNDVSPKKFRSHVEQALASGYRFVPAEVIALGQGGPRDLAITFDDGLSSVAIHAAPVLATYNIPWTLFVVAQWAEGQHAWGASTFLSWRDIERLVEMGVTIGSHSVSHPRFRYLSSDETAQELEDSRRIIESRIGILPATFAIPMGQSGDWSAQAQDLAAAAGYAHIFAQSEDRRPPGTIGRTFITRFDSGHIFRAALAGAFDRWEEWV